MEYNTYRKIYDKMILCIYRNYNYKILTHYRLIDRRYNIMVKKNIKNLRQLELDFDEKPKFGQLELDFDEKPKFGQLKLDTLDIYDKDSDSKFNDKNIFTGNYEKPFIYKNKQMTEEDRNKFIKLNENVKLKIVETLLDNEENSKIMESNMENILKELNNFKEQFEKMKEDKIEENNEKIAREKEKAESDKYGDKVLQEIIDRDKGNNKVKETALDSNINNIYSGMVTVGHHGRNNLLGVEPFNSEILTDSYVETILGEYLKLRGITQIWLSEMIGVDKTTIVNIIKKPKSISLLNAYKISALLDEKIETLFPFMFGEE